MTTHITVLPEEVLQVLSTSFSDCDTVPDGVSWSFLRLPHPRTGLSALFFGTNERLFEIQSVIPPNNRSWFIEDEVVADGKLALMTPIDPVFLLIPILQCLQTPEGSAAFRQAEDLFEFAGSKIQNSIFVEDINRLGLLLCVKNALKCICQTKDIMSEIIVYRFSTEQTMAYLQRKIARLSSPAILEISRSIIRQLSKDGLVNGVDEDTINAGRLKAACDLLGQYLTPETQVKLLALYDFSKLDNHVKTIRLVEADLVAATEKLKDKKRKAPKGEESTKVVDKKKKLNKESHGVEKLKKANINGMTKLSSFFKKA